VAKPFLANLARDGAINRSMVQEIFSRVFFNLF